MHIMIKPLNANMSASNGRKDDFNEESAAVTSVLCSVNTFHTSISRCVLLKCYWYFTFPGTKVQASFWGTIAIASIAGSRPWEG